MRFEMHFARNLPDKGKLICRCVSRHIRQAASPTLFDAGGLQIYVIFRPQREGAGIILFSLE